MSAQELWEKCPPQVQKNIVPITLGVSGLLFLGYGVISYLVSSQAQSADANISPIDPNISVKNSNVEGLSTSSKKFTVDVQGGVMTPGVYRLPSDSRIQDAVVAAGGFSANADRVWAAHNLNLAAKLSDGMKVYVKTMDEASQTSSGAPGEVSGSGSDQNQLINVNTADAATLDTLVGVGEVTAQKIISGRPYNQLQDLVTKKALTQKQFDKIKEKITN